MLSRLSLALLLGSAAAPAALACAFHMYSPQDTVVDRMLASDHIVLARANPDDPFRYKAVSAIEGGIEDVELPFLVDSVTRRKLNLRPDDMVMFLRDGSYGPWEKVAYLDSDYMQIIDDVAANLETWIFQDEWLRYAYFAPLISHQSHEIRRLALSELDKAPYEVLRQLKVDATMDAFRDNLFIPAEAELLPLKTLLIGLTAEEEAVDLLQNRFASVVRQKNLPGVGATATALIEIEGIDGLATVVSTLSTSPDLTVEVAEAAIEAIAIHDLVGSEDLRGAIHDRLGALVAERPDIAGGIARQFGSRGGWQMADELSELIAARQVRDLASLMAVGQYVALAREAASTDF